MRTVDDPRLKRARKAFTEFSGHRPQKVVKRQLDDHAVTGYRLGSLLGVAYEARRDGKTDRYFHEFGKKARPDLVVKDDGSQLYISGGQYQVTDHGIEDMPALFVVNPSPRRKKAAKSTSKKRKPATMARRRRSPIRRRRVARRSVATFARNPIRRRRRRASSRTAMVVGRRRRSYRRNPIVGVRRRRRSLGGGRGFPKITSLIMPALGIGAGAVLSEVAIGYLPIPANFKTGPARHLTKGVVSLALGMAVAKFANKKAGELMALGGLTIAVHDSIKELVLRYAPSTKFAGMGYYNPAQTMQLGQYVNTSPGGFGEYMAPNYGFAGNSGGETEFSV